MKIKRFALLLCSFSMGSMAMLAGCDKDESGGGQSLPERGGAQLWALNCRRCHNARPPTAFSDDQWEVIVNHMRIRAGLTAVEARKITEFLKAAN